MLKTKFFYQPLLATVKFRFDPLHREQVVSKSDWKTYLAEGLLVPPESTVNAMPVEKITYGVGPLAMLASPKALLPYPLVYLRAEYPFLENRDRLTGTRLIMTESLVDAKCSWFQAFDCWSGPLQEGLMMGAAMKAYGPNAMKAAKDEWLW